MQATGAVLGGRYALEKQLGQGAAASVFLAHDRQLDRAVALKVLNGEGIIADPRRFEYEARALARLEHEHIVRVYDYGIHEAYPYLVLERVEGGNLQDLVGRGPLPVERVLPLGTALLEALGYAHAQGVLHRDVKPENVLLTRDGVPKLSDFGLAKGEGSGIRTRTGIIMGTPEYIAPEVFAGDPAVPGSDLYAWGCMMYLFLNGRLPFVGNISEIATAKASGGYERGRESGPLRTAIRKALALAPGARGSAADLLEVLAGKDAAPHKATVMLSSADAAPEVAPRPGHRARTPALAAGVVGLVALAFTLGVTTSTATTPATPPTATQAATATRDASALAARWARAVADLDAAARTRDLNADAMPPASLMDSLLAGFPQRHMVAVRKGAPSKARLGSLEAAIPTLPLRAELRADRAELAEVLGDPAVPFDQRLQLFLSLQRLIGIDALYEAWGLLPPLRIRPLLDRLIPIRTLDPPGDLPPAPPPVPAGPLGPGRFLLFRWPDASAAWPLVFPRVGEPAEYERIAFELYVKESDGAFVPEDRLGIDGEVRLAGVTALADREVLLTAWVGGMFTANELVVTWNDVPLRVPAEPRRSEHEYWNNERIPEYVLEIRLPPELLRDGVNRYSVDTRALPGLPRCCATAFDRLVLEVR